MKILHIIPSLSGGGAEKQLSILSKTQSLMGHDVYIILIKGGVNLKNALSGNVKIIFLDELNSINPLLLISLVMKIKKIKPDIIQTWLPQMDFLGGLSAIILSIPWIISERTSVDAYKKFKFIFLLRLIVAKKASLIISNSKGGYDYWSSHAPSSKLRVIPNLVEIDEILSSEIVYDSLIRPSSSVYLSVGRLIDLKSHDTIIKAFSLIPNKYNYHLYIIGTGPSYAALKNLVNSLSLSDNITFLKYVKNWWGLLKSSRAFISASHFEGHPNSLLEAIAGNCPVVVSDTPSHREFLNEENAFFFPKDEYKFLSNIIISDLNGYSKISTNPIFTKYLLSNLSCQKIYDDYMTAYKYILFKD